MVEKLWIVSFINRYAKASNGYDKNKEFSYLKYWEVDNLYGWAMSQKLPVNGFKDIINPQNSLLKTIIFQSKQPMTK